MIKRYEDKTIVLFTGKNLKIYKKQMIGKMKKIKIEDNYKEEIDGCSEIK
jgi:hypothetical protein